MKRKKLIEIHEEERNSPNKKYHLFRKHISEALGGLTNKGTWGGGHPFDIEFVTANRKSGEAGEIKSLQNMVYVWPRKSTNQKKDPNHILNGTMDLQPAGGGEITRVHLFLIRKLNNKILS